MGKSPNPKKRDRRVLRESYNKKRKQQSKKKSFLSQIKAKEELKARGVIIKFHHWPNSKQHKSIVKRLKATGLKKTKSIKSFQTVLFSWSKGGLKPSKLGKKACKKLKGFIHC